MTPTGKLIKVSCRKNHSSKDQMMRGSWQKKGGWRTGTPSRGTADAEAWKERGLPEALTLGSSLSNAISIHQEIMLALPSKYIQGLSSFPTAALKPPMVGSWGRCGGDVKHRGGTGKTYTLSKRWEWDLIL